MTRYKLTIAYEGTEYSGWQIQPNASSIQEHIQKAIKVFLHSDEIILIGSGRTDAGVHALAQIAHFNYDHEFDHERFLYAMSGMLPPDIRVKTIDKVSNDFHAQYSAIGKEYHYHIYLDRVMDPFKRRYCWHVYRRLDLDLLKKGAGYFVGKHDFTSFANEAHSGSAARNPVRTLHRVDPIEVEGGIRIEFEGDGFLYKMVRNIVGTLVDVASGRYPPEEIVKIFESKDRRIAARAAPPHGLFLVKVVY